ncbi:MAG: hypothetical protein ACO39X_06925 [Candidatus Nanopelagicaceae bacterium]
MTYATRPVAPIAVDFLRLGAATGNLPANPILTITGTPTNTNATVSSNQITLPAGSHWRIEASNQAITSQDSNYSELFFLDIYDVNAASNVGFAGVISESIPGTNTGYLTRGRATACAFILSSDISTSMTLRLQIIAPSGELRTSTDGLKLYGIVKIMELPT